MCENILMFWFGSILSDKDITIFFLIHDHKFGNNDVLTCIRIDAYNIHISFGIIHDMLRLKNEVKTHTWRLQCITLETFA